MMFSSVFEENLETFDCVLEVESPYGKRSQRMEAPRIMIEQQFLSLFEQAAQSRDPIMVSIRRYIPIFDDFDQSYKDIEANIVFKNNAYIFEHGE